MKPVELMQAAGNDVSTPAPFHDVVTYGVRLVDALELAFAA